MNQKGLAPILIVIILATLAGGYLVYQNQPKPTPSPQPTTQPLPTSSPQQITQSSPQAKVTLKKFTSIPLNYAFYTKKFLDLISYPSTITSLSRDNLKNATCSERFTVNDYGFEFELVAGIPQQVLKEILAKEAAAFILCDLGDKYLLVYETWGGGGGSKNIAHTALINKDPFTFTYLIEIPREGAYFGCFTVHAVTNDNHLYVECGGGDVSYSYSVYDVNLINKSKTRLVNCYGEPTGDEKFADTCVDNTGKQILYKVK